MNQMKIRDYVIATKYNDGEPNEPWAVGWINQILIEKDRKIFYLSNSKGENIYRNGYRRVKKISIMEASFFIDNCEKIERSGKSIWTYLNQIRKGKIDLCD